MPYSDEFLEHLRYPRNLRQMDGASATGHADLGGTTPSIDVYICISDQVVTQITYQTAGCGALMACASLASLLIQGKSLAECATFSSDDLLDAIGELPVQKQFCAELVACAIRQAAARGEQACNKGSHF